MVLFTDKFGVRFKNFQLLVQTPVLYSKYMAESGFTCSQTLQKYGGALLQLFRNCFYTS